MYLVELTALLEEAADWPELLHSRGSAGITHQRHLSLDSLTLQNYCPNAPWQALIHEGMLSRRSFRFCRNTMDWNDDKNKHTALSFRANGLTIRRTDVITTARSQILPVGVFRCCC